MQEIVEECHILDATHIFVAKKVFYLDKCVRFAEI